MCHHEGIAVSEVRVIDKNDEMCGFVGDVLSIGSGGVTHVYFDDMMGTLIYYPHQIEYVTKED